MADLQWRRLGPADLEALEWLERQSQAHPAPRASLAAALGDAERVVLGLAAEGRLVGQAVVARQPFDAELESIAVLPAWRRQGVAGRLLAAVIDQARAWGSERLLLEVRAGNAAAIALYRRQGFGEDGRRRGYYPPLSGMAREDAVLMSRRP